MAITDVVSSVAGAFIQPAIGGDSLPGIVHLLDGQSTSYGGERLTQSCHLDIFREKFKIKGLSEEVVKLLVRGHRVTTSHTGAPGTVGMAGVFNGVQRGLCPVACLRSYVEKTDGLRGSEEGILFSLKSPFKQVGSTIDRWIKSRLKDAGIDTSVFSAHSTRRILRQRHRSLEFQWNRFSVQGVGHRSRVFPDITGEWPLITTKWLGWCWMYLPKFYQRYFKFTKV